MSTARLLGLGVVAAMALAACGSGATVAGGQGGSASPSVSISLPQVTSSPKEQVPSALVAPTAGGLPRPLVDPADIQSGGPPPDGIPAIDHPRFERTAQVNWLAGREPVLALQIGGDTRAYPVQVLIWHEIVNDTVDGAPVALTYCPLCNTAIAYDRRVGDRVLDFGTSGKLYNSDLVAYDRQTQSLWVQFTGQAVAGVLTGTTLASFPVATVSFASWRANHPRGWVLSHDTGYQRPYGQNPYPGYDNTQGTPFLYSGNTDSRLAAMARVVGIRAGTDAVAIVNDDLRRRRVIEVDLAGSPVVVFGLPGTVSALQDTQVAAGRDVGATGAFDPVLGGRHLHFAATTSGFRDLETRSTWDVLGRATSGSLAGEQLSPVLHVDTFWFAWSAFLPHTRIVRS